VSFDAQLLELGDALRREGVAIGTSELMDGFAALREVGWTEPATFKEALAATLVKSPEDRRVFELVFERFMFRAAEQAALQQNVREGDEGSDAGAGQMEADGEGAGEGEGDGAGELDFDALRALVEEAIRNDDESAMRDLARLAIAAFGQRGQGSGVLGVDVQRIRRSLGLRSEPGRPPQEDQPGDERPPLTRDQIRRFEQLLRRELERSQIERNQELPPARPLNDLDRALPSGPLQDLAAVHRVVAQLKRRLATPGRSLIKI
jgi:uncharacterized protein with von Willebrand factor type A (vWA) domain